MNNLNKVFNQRIQSQLLGGRRFWGFMFSFLLLWACKSDPVDPENPDNKKPDPSTFGFTLLKITDVKEISVEMLKKQLKSESGWTIKSIKIDDESFAEVTGSLPNLKIILKKSGSFTASITLQKKGWQDFVLKDCKIQVVLPQFSFSKFTQIKGKKTITSVEILKQIAGAQAAGYSIKSIVVSDENFAKVSGTAPTLQIDIQKVGKFTATIVLSHKSFFEITLQNCAFEIVPEFIFDKLIVSSSGSKTITAADLLKQIAGAVAAGYTIKSIAITEDTKKLATANGTAITLDLTKTGVFKATIILKKDQHSDITLKDCAFEVSGKKAAPTLTFTKLERKFSTAPITKAEILKQIKQDITGWTLKNVVLSNPTFGSVDSKFSIILKKIGNFSATLTFERAGYVNALVTGSFEITKGLAASLKFTELKRSFKGDKIITAARILGQIAGVKTLGYGLKSIGKIDNPDVASASGTQITIKKVGTFTAELILESAYYEDAKVQASFEVSGKNVAPVLSFATLKRNYSGSKTITKAQILNQITATSGQSDWAGFVLKEIVLTENVSLARVNNSKFEITILKAGTFKARLTFTKDTYVDAVVTGTFEIAKVAAPSLGFTPISKKFGGSNTISKTEILNKITGNKTGYVLKSIVPSDDSFASVGGGFEMTLRRAGNFTATITLQRENYEDAIIPNCSFKIAPGDAPTDLRLTAFVRKFSDSRTITAADIFAKISGKKDGYVLKSISINSGNDVARVSSNQKEITIQKLGTFTADIVLERANYEDATIANVIFTIEKEKVTLSFAKTELVKTYGDTNVQSPTLSGAYAGSGAGAISYSSSDTGIATVTNTGAITIKTAGQVTITATQAETAKYQKGTATFTLKINKKILRITGLQDGDPKVYDGEPSPKGTPVLNGVVAGDAVAFADGYPKYSFDKTKIGKDTPIKVEVKLKGTKTDSYEVSPLTGLKQDLEIAVDFDPKTKSVKGLLAKHSAITKIAIPATINGTVVDSIGKGAFNDNKTLKSVIIDEGIKYIAEIAFSQSNLEKVSFPKTLVEINSFAFYKAVKLKKVDLSHTNLKKLDNKLFKECVELTEVKLNNSIKIINVEVFLGCSKLTTINIPTSLEIIGQKAFMLCSALANIDLSTSTRLKKIYTGAFYACDKLEIIEIPSTVEIIYQSPFIHCGNLKSVTMTSNIKTLYDYLFQYTTKVVVKIIFTDKDDIIRSMDHLTGVRQGFVFNTVKEIQVPKGKKAVLIKNAVWKKYESKITEY